MLEQIRYHRFRGALKHCYACIGSTLLKPKVPPVGMPDINEGHLKFLRGKKPITVVEKLIHAILVHENTHSERQIRSWVWWHEVRYIVSKSFRWDEEKAAYGAEIGQMVRYQLRISSTRLAKSMSGPIYRRMFRNMVGYEEALRWVREAITAAEIKYFAECMESDDGASGNDESADEFDINNEMVAPLRAMSVVKDRIALVCCACIGFVTMFSVLMALEFLSGAFRAKH